mmetsp:Transcript_9534/g.38900  ORF Transcript_9534/g.38900 Transcript_9534/m.38900 type:complete len:340 (-) Transcript_9534:1200-2219(-)
MSAPGTLVERHGLFSTVVASTSQQTAAAMWAQIGHALLEGLAVDISTQMIETRMWKDPSNAGAYIQMQLPTPRHLIPLTRLDCRPLPVTCGRNCHSERNVRSSLHAGSHTRNSFEKVRTHLGVMSIPAKLVRDVKKSLEIGRTHLPHADCDGLHFQLVGCSRDWQAKLVHYLCFWSELHLTPTWLRDPISAMSTIIQCVMLSEEHAMDAYHAWALSLLAELHLSLGNTGMALILLHSCLPKLLEHAPLIAQGRAWLNLSRCHLHRAFDIGLTSSDATLNKKRELLPNARVREAEKSYKQAIVCLENAYEAFFTAHDLNCARFVVYIQVCNTTICIHPCP